jgi:hypothetical protein
MKRRKKARHASVGTAAHPCGHYGFINRKKLLGSVNGEIVICLFVPTTVGTFVTFIQFVVLKSLFRWSTKLVSLVGQVLLDQKTSAFSPLTSRTRRAMCESGRKGRCPHSEWVVGRVAE